MGLISLGILLLLVNVILAQQNKNVLLIMVDDLRPQLGVYEGPYFPSPTHPKMITPNLDALAAKSLLFQRAYVQQAICSPSRASFLTGRRPDTTHVYDLDSYFRDVGGNMSTIPQYFKANGYASIGMGKIFHRGPASGGDNDPLSWTTEFYKPDRNLESTEESWAAVPDDQAYLLRDDQTANKAVETLQALANDGTPFFLAVGFYKPHLPFVFPESYLDLYPEENIQLPPNPYAPTDMAPDAWAPYGELRSYGDIAILNATGEVNTTLPDFKVKELRRAYYAAVSWIDALIGKVLDELTEQGLESKTIVALWSDHGWQLGEHGLWCKHTNFEIAAQIPMMLRVPGKTDDGIVTDELVESVDMFQTLVDAAGLPLVDVCPENSSEIAVCTEGISLMPLIKEPTTPLKCAAFYQYPRYNAKRMGYTIRTDRYRYTEWVKFNADPVYQPDWTKIHGIELYDHEVDPEENVNRVNYEDYANVVTMLSKKLRIGWRNAVISS